MTTKMSSFYVIAATLILSFCLPARALAPMSNYYPQVLRQALQDQVPSSQLKKVLFDVLSMAHLSTGTQPDKLEAVCPRKATTCYKQRMLSYKLARIKMFGELHLIRKNGHYAIKGVYCSKTIDDSHFPNGGGPAPGKIPSVSIFNTEHTWPQSKFSRSFPKALQKGDLHILFPVESKVNSLRGNYPFGNVGTATQTPCPVAKRGLSGQSGRVIFEPADEHKGNVARAMFYFSVRYKMVIDQEQERVLREWNHLDPIDEFERTRNDQIFAIQGNRNPFIDNPELSSMIDDF